MKSSQKVYEDARSLLEDTKIIELFNDLGTVYIVGSHAANLMCDPDIDVVVVTDTPQESAIKAINVLARSEKFQKLEFGDFKNHPKKNRPESFIVNVRKEWKGEKMIFKMTAETHSVDLDFDWAKIVKIKSDKRRAN